MTSDKLIQLFHSQARSSKLWVNEWHKNKDGAAAKNALFALGKVQGIFSLICVEHGASWVPKDVTDVVDKNQEVFDEIMNTTFLKVQ